MRACKWQQEPKAPCCAPSPAVRALDAVGDLAAEGNHGRGGTKAEFYRPDNLTANDHVEPIRGHPRTIGVTREAFAQAESELTVGEITGLLEGRADHHRPLPLCAKQQLSRINWPLFCGRNSPLQDAFLRHKQAEARASC
jgi:hypothetical protein